jgi:hypothetical protein
LKFREICARYFPEIPAQVAKERFVIISAKPRAFRKTTTKQKAPNWQAHEIEILEKAIVERKAASEILALLPHRAVTSIGTKMSWLRKRHRSLAS